MGVITQAHTAYTMSDERYAQITKRVSALRRMSMERLLALCNTYYTEFHSEYMQNKGDTFAYILQHEFGWETMEVYNAVHMARKARKPRRRKGQYTLPIT